MAAEIIDRKDFEYSAIIPSLISSSIAYAIFGTTTGCHPIFSIPALNLVNSPISLLYFAIFGVVCALIGIAPTRRYFIVQLPLQRSCHFPGYYAHLLADY
ncbi:voltage gated chloride channel [Acidithrix ferrooxidans]|uniref:Voltage gated chloride channel n=1 Tax=Acidithrix ferrooxidans TaxID=1280514 RepID=A0A0D8HCY4_9ACTN|nr:voltage gated chloride channel [Acidithrix ferrooxidans]